MFSLDICWLKCKKTYTKTINWFLKYEKQLLLIIGFVIIALLCFVFGLLKGAQLIQKPILVTKPLGEPVIIKEVCNENLLDATNCIYVGSIKGTKYYPPSCSFAKKISKENLRCFESDKDAQAKGYTRSKSCK